ncbi:MAG TPA: hypothetical protein DD803_16165 [Alcaligenes faecalis]|nr:hypothetical protein [Alcaligenes faecalis]HBQ90971.1 hypothetical protein [Alcaligenes faecalis]
MKAPVTLRELLVIAGLCTLTEDGDEAIRLTLKKEVVHLFGEDAFERLDAIEASDGESEEVMLQILRSLAVDQELLDVKAGIPARDAEIEALRKQVETLQAQLVDRSPEMQGSPVDESPNLQSQKQPVSGADGLADYPTHGMSLGQRIAYVGGRENAQGYVEFGSPMAVHALIQHVLRDFHRQGRVNLTPAKQTTDPLQGAADWLVRDCGVSDPAGLANRLGIGYNRASRLVDAARKEPEQ